VRIGGNKFDNSISEYIRRKYNLAIGERTSEDIKIEIGAAMYSEGPAIIDIRGRDMITGLPKTISISSNDATEALQKDLQGIVDAVKEVLQQTPPELSADVIDKGIIMSGGSSLLRDIDQLISRAVGVPVYVADDALLCVAKGTGIALDNLEMYKRSVLATK